MRGEPERQEPEPVDDVVLWIQQHEPPLDLDLEAGLKDVYRRAAQATERPDRD
jgi:hypothetical protein